MEGRENRWEKTELRWITYMCTNWSTRNTNRMHYKRTKKQIQKVCFVKYLVNVWKREAVNQRKHKEYVRWKHYIKYIENLQNSVMKKQLIRTIGKRHIYFNKEDGKYRERNLTLSVIKNIIHFCHKHGCVRSILIL